LRANGYNFRQDTRHYVYVVSQSNNWQQGRHLIDDPGKFYFDPLLDENGNHITVNYWVYLDDFNWPNFIGTYTATGSAIGGIELGKYVYGPVRSPDGSKIAFSTVRGEGEQRVSELYVGGVGQPPKIIYSDSEGRAVRQFSVSNDGKVAFYLEGDSKGREGVFLYQNGNIMLLNSDLHFCNPMISGDGQKLYCLYNDLFEYKFSLYEIDINDGSYEMLGTYNVHTGLSLTNNDGSVIVFRGYNETNGFGIFALVKGEGVTIPPMLNLDLQPMLPPKTTIIAGSAEAPQGSDIQVPVKIENADKVGSINLILSYPNVLEVEDVLQGSLTQNSLFDYNVEGNQIKVGIADSNGISGDGSLFYVKFRVTGNEKAEQAENVKGKLRGLGQQLSEITLRNSHALTLQGIEIYDIDGNSVKVATINGTFRIVSQEEANKGDVNGDGEINSLDALLALQMSIGKVEPNPVADMDGDGKVLAKDATEIMKMATDMMIRRTAEIISQNGLLGK